MLYKYIHGHFESDLLVDEESGESFLITNPYKSRAYGFFMIGKEGSNKWTLLRKIPDYFSGYKQSNPNTKQTQIHT